MINIQNLSHRYNGRVENALNDVTLRISDSEIAILLGSSGAGKSTLLNCINRMIEPDEGQVFINGEDILALKRREVERIRQGIGMIFQHFNIVEGDSVLKNVLNGRLSYVDTIPGILGRFSEEDINIARECLQRVGLAEYAEFHVRNLSGGQKQRVAIARTLAQQPSIILADEPVASLDPKLMVEIMELLQSICKEDNIALVVSLHFLELARKYATRIIGIRKGQVVFDGANDELTDKDLVNIYGETEEWYLYGKLGF